MTGSSASISRRPLDFVSPSTAPSAAHDANAAVGRLYARLKYASEKVCYVSDDNRNLRIKHLQADCMQGALNRAVERVNEPKLTQLHAAEPRIRVAAEKT